MILYQKKWSKNDPGSFLDHFSIFQRRIILDQSFLSSGSKKMIKFLIRTKKNIRIKNKSRFFWSGSKKKTQIFDRDQKKLTWFLIRIKKKMSFFDPDKKNEPDFWSESWNLMAQIMGSWSTGSNRKRSNDPWSPNREQFNFEHTYYKKDPIFFT